MRPVPKIKAAIKSVRQTEKRRERNLRAKTRLRTLYKKAARGAEQQFGRTVEAQFDKAAAKGIIHPNKAARKKSRLARAQNAAGAQTPQKETKRTGRKKTATRKSPARAASRKKA